MRDSLPALELVVTGDFDQGAGASGFNFAGTMAADLPAIVSGKAEVRREATVRTALIFSGTGLADVAVAQLVFERALENGLGVRLAL